MTDLVLRYDVVEGELFVNVSDLQVWLSQTAEALDAVPGGEPAGAVVRTVRDKLTVSIGSAS